jgi:hypothetical protein
MTDASEVAVVASIEDLVSLISLKEIRFYEVGSRTKALGNGSGETPKVSLGYSERSENEELEDRFRFVFETDVADYLVELSAIYDLKEPRTVPQAIRVDFAERIGFMAVFPFVREALVNGAARLGKTGPLLDFMRPGDLKIEWNPEPDDPDTPITWDNIPGLTDEERLAGRAMLQVPDLRGITIDGNVVDGIAVPRIVNGVVQR